MKHSIPEGRHRITGTLLAVFSIVIAALLLDSCGGYVTGNEVTDSDYPETPDGVVSAFYQSLDGHDCASAMKFVSFETGLNQNRKLEVFIKDAAAAAEVQKLGDEIHQMEEVESVQFVSKDEALQRLREGLKGHEDVLDALAGNPLPSSYEITLKDPQDIEKVMSRLSGNPIVDDVNGNGFTPEMKSNAINGTRDACKLITSDYNYWLKDFDITAVDAGPEEATVKFKAVAAIDGAESTPDEFTLTLVKSQGMWKIDYFKSLLSIKGYSGFISLMLFNNKDMGGKIDITKLGTSKTETATAEALGR